MRCSIRRKVRYKCANGFIKLSLTINKKSRSIKLVRFFLCSEKPIKPRKLKINIYFLIFMVVYRKSIYIFEDTKQLKLIIMKNLTFSTELTIENLRTYLTLETCDMMISYTKGKIEALKLKNPKSKKLNKKANEFASINTNDITQAFWKGYASILNELNK